MQASEIISDCRFELLEPIPGFWTDAELLNQINKAQQDYVNQTRILCLLYTSRQQISFS